MNGAHTAHGKPPGAAHAVELPDTALYQAQRRGRRIDIDQEAGGDAQDVAQLGLVTLQIAAQEAGGAFGQDQH